MFKGFLSKDKIILGVLILVLLGLISLIAFHFKFTNGVLAQQLYSNFQKSLNPSKLNLALDKTDLKLDFKINPADKTSIEAFLKDLEIDNSENPLIDIKLGDSLAIYLDELLRKNNFTSGNISQVNLNLRILAKEIDFDNKKAFGPFDVLDNLLESPSDTGDIRVQTLGANSYVVEIDNPEKALSDATQSGTLRLSENLIDSRWWQVLTKVARIKIRIEDGWLSGTILLK